MTQWETRTTIGDFPWNGVTALYVEMTQITFLAISAEDLLCGFFGEMCPLTGNHQIFLFPALDQRNKISKPSPLSILSSDSSCVSFFPSTIHQLQVPSTNGTTSDSNVKGYSPVPWSGSSCPLHHCSPEWTGKQTMPIKSCSSNNIERKEEKYFLKETKDICK